MILTDGKDGQKLVVVGVAEGEISLQALRFGIGEGSEITVEKNIPGGPVIISKNHLEIAIGRHLAGSISVSPRKVNNNHIEGRSHLKETNEPRPIDLP